MYVRYQTSQGEGLFRFASDLRSCEEMPRHDQRLARELLDWFNDHLPAPPGGAYTPPRHLRATTWFRYRHRECIDRAFLLATLVTEYVTPMHQVRSRHPGRVVFRDEWQVVAWMFRPTPPPERAKGKRVWDGRNRSTIRRMKWGKGFEWPLGSIGRHCTSDPYLRRRASSVRRQEK